MKTIEKQKTIEHPMEGLLDITPGTTVIEYTEIVPGDVVKMPDYDAKDDEIEGKLEEIYTVAMGNVQVIADEMDRVEGKYKARIGEVTATMLNVALGAVKHKADLKMHKDKQKADTPSGTATHTTNNNLVVADRNDIIRMLIDSKNNNK